MTTKIISKQRAMQIARNNRMGYDTVISYFSYNGIVIKTDKKNYRDELKALFRNRYKEKDKERVLELYQYIMYKIKKIK